MTKAQAERNVWLYYPHIIFNESLLTGIYYVTILGTLAGMSLPEILYLEACVLVLNIVLEVPAGIFSDAIGRKPTLIIARVFHGAGSLLIIFVTSPIDVWVVTALWSVGTSLQSDADTSLLQETLAERGLAHRLRAHTRYAQASRDATKAILMLGAGFLLEWDMRVTLAISLALTLIPLVCSFFYTEPSRRVRHQSFREATAQIAQGVRDAWKMRAIWWIVGFTAVVTISTSVWFWHNPYYTLVGIPLVLFGFVSSLTNLCRVLGALLSDKLERRIGERYMVLGVILVLGISNLVMGLFPSILAALCVGLKTAVAGFLKPFADAYLNRHIISNDARNTVLSIRSIVKRLVGAIASAVFGVLIDVFGMLDAVIVLGVTVLLLGLASYRAYTKLP